MCACLSMRELRSITQCDVFAMLLRTYIDDSADETQERALVAGAYVGFYHQWNKLQQRWKARLKKDGLKFFHATDYYSLRGEFFRFRDVSKYPKPSGSKAATAILEDLECIIHDVGVMGVAACIDMAAYRDVRQTQAYAKDIFPQDAFEFAIQTIVDMCAKLVRDAFSDPQRKVAFVCDDGPTSAKIAAIYGGFKNSNPHLADYMAGLTHQDDKLFPQLQAADLMAHLAKGRFIEWLDDPQKKIFSEDQRTQQRLKRLSVHRIGAWDRDFMMQVLSNEIAARKLPAGV